MSLALSLVMSMASVHGRISAFRAELLCILCCGPSSFSQGCLRLALQTKHRQQLCPFSTPSPTIRKKKIQISHDSVFFDTNGAVELVCRHPSLYESSSVVRGYLHESGISCFIRHRRGFHSLTFSQALSKTTFLKLE